MSCSFFRRQALLCVLAKNCSETNYSRLVEALCNEHQIKLLKVRCETRALKNNLLWENDEKVYKPSFGADMS